MTLLPLLLAAVTSAQVVRGAAASAARPPAPVLHVWASLSAPSLAPSLAPTLAPALPAAGDAPAPLAPAAGLVADREAALVAKLAAKLPSQDATTRGKTADWIRDVALENPRAAVQSAAVNALADDAVAAGNLAHFENVAAGIERIAQSTSFDHVFEDAVARLVEAARISGRAQRRHALGVAERLGVSASAERREKAAALIETLKADPSFRLESDELDRAAERIRSGR
jgi:hypothetical protein